MIWSIAWRNVWRNKTRSLVIISAITLGIFAGVFIIAFLFGWVNQRTNSVIKTEVSHIQIHQKNYLQTNDVQLFIKNSEAIKNQIAGLEAVKGVTSRLLVSGMISSAEAKSGIQIVGISNEEEKKVTNLYTRLVSGAYLEGIKRNPIVIGEKLAKKLNVKLRSKIVLTIAELDGTLTKAAFRVAGIYETSNTAYDAYKVFVRNKDLHKFMKAPEGIAHELAILVNSNQNEEKLAGQLQSKYPNLAVAAWTELIPDIKLMNENMNLMTYIFVGIILLALGFGIVNTMLMVILERIQELGMVMAIGMNTTKVFLMIVIETLLLSVSGGGIGILLALITIAITYQTGIDLSIWAEGLQVTGFDTIIYPVIKITEILKVTFLVILTGILAAIYPARKAIKLNPSEALRVQ